MTRVGKAVLVLEDGQVFPGEAYGATGTTLGELVFTTGMTGYQETLTDPSYHRQIIVFTAPHIGNTGVNDEDPESSRIWASGLVVRDPARMPSNWRSVRPLDDDLVDGGIVGIAGVDTRQLTRTLRTVGVMRAGIFSGEEAGTVESMLDAVRSSPKMTGAHLADEVTTGEAYDVAPPSGTKERAHVVAVDLGVKAMSPQLMAKRGIRVTVVPSTVSASEVTRLKPDGVFLSNGPGDPAAAEAQVEMTREIIGDGIPTFGICFGHQIIGRALGFGTYKLRFGHRGINQPVMDRTTGKVEVTAHNHGFAVDAPLEGEVEAPQGGLGKVRVSHVCLNDDVVEGLECLDRPVFSVQYHPEAAAGPHDAAYLFDRFLDLMKDGR